MPAEPDPSSGRRAVDAAAAATAAAGGFTCGVFVGVVPGTRTFTGRRRVGLGDTDRHGALRADALAAYLQDLATADYESSFSDAPAAPDDSGAAGASSGTSTAPRTGDAEVLGWVVRRTTAALAEGRWPRLGETLRLTTFAGGLGSHWAERRTTVDGPAGRVEVAALWVCVDASGRPAPLGDHFLHVYGDAAAGRRVRSRAGHGDPVPGAGERPWVVRAADIDTLAHVNNAAQLQVVEEVRLPGGLAGFEAEYRQPIGASTPLLLRTAADPERPGCVRSWLVQTANTGPVTMSSARVLIR